MATQSLVHKFVVLFQWSWELDYDVIILHKETKNYIPRLNIYLL